MDGLSTVTLPSSIETPTSTVDRRAENLLSTNYISYFAWPTYSARSRPHSRAGEGARVHAHAYLEGRKQYDCSLSHFALVFPPESNDGDAYESVPGDCQSNTVTGSGFRPAANRGHFYVQSKYKNTHIAERNNYLPIRFPSTSPNLRMSRRLRRRCETQSTILDFVFRPQTLQCPNSFVSIHTAMILMC